MKNLSASWGGMGLLAMLILTGCGQPSTEAELKPRLLEVAALLQAGKNEEATRTVNALLVLYPEDPRLLALRAQAATPSASLKSTTPANPLAATVDAGIDEIDRLTQAGKLPEALAAAKRLSAAYPQDARVSALVTRVVAAAPTGRQAVLAPEDLPGLERVKYSAGEQLLHEARAAGADQPEVRLEKLRSFLAQSADLAAARPTLRELHLRRAFAALEAREREAGVQAVAALLPLGILDTKDATQLALLGKLQNEGWIEEGIALAEATPALTELQRLAEAKDYVNFGRAAAACLAKWRGSPSLRTRAVPLVAAVEAASGQDLPGWNVNTNANAKQRALENALPKHAEALGLVKIEPGTFIMGSASDGDPDERPPTRVTLSQAYWLGKYEVTQRDWRELMGTDPSAFKGDNHPVEQVSWNDAMDFCRKLTKRERVAGRLPESYAYTLPTEAQWEYACRAGTTGDYSGSGDYKEMGWYDDNSGWERAKPVGQKRPNAWGLYDMHGNVEEFCADWYGEYPGGSVIDPPGAASGSARVLRGGSWWSNRYDMRSANRNSCGPEGTYPFLGFRLALSPVATKP